MLCVVCHSVLSDLCCEGFWCPVIDLFRSGVCGVALLPYTTTARSACCAVLFGCLRNGVFWGSLLGGSWGYLRYPGVYIRSG